MHIRSSKWENLTVYIDGLFIVQDISCSNFYSQRPVCIGSNKNQVFSLTLIHKCDSKKNCSLRMCLRYIHSFYIILSYHRNLFTKIYMRWFVRKPGENLEYFLTSNRLRIKNRSEKMNLTSFIMFIQIDRHVLAELFVYLPGLVTEWQININCSNIYSLSTHSI